MPLLTDVPGVRVLLEADVGVTVAGSNVAAWANQAAGFTTEFVEQTTAAKQPLLTPAGLNGLPVLSFDGVDDGLIMPAGSTLGSVFRNLGGATLVALARDVAPVVTTTGEEPRSLIQGLTNAAGAARALIHVVRHNKSFNNGCLRTGGRRLDADAFASIYGAPGSFGHNAWAVASAKYDWSAASVFLDRNAQVQNQREGNYQTAGLTSDTEALGFGVGSKSDAAFEFLWGDMAVVAVWQRAITLAEEATVQAAIEEKWGVGQSAGSKYQSAIGTMSRAGGFRA